jgi:hypothetical protein
MSTFEFVSHENYPEDEYTKEAVVLCIEKKHRVTYVRKKMTNGGMFWDVISAAVKHHGEKKYLKSYSQDSNFLYEDIKSYLENRSWEKGGQAGSIQNSKSEKFEDIPF